MPSLKSVKNRILKNSNVQNSGEPSKTSLNSISLEISPKSGRKKKSFKSKLKNGLKGSKKSIPQSASCHTTMDFEKLEDLQAQIEELRRDLKETNFKPKLQDDFVSELPKQGGDTSTSSEEQQLISNQSMSERSPQISEESNINNEFSRTVIQKYQINDLKLQVKLNRELISVQKSEIEKLQREKEVLVQCRESSVSDELISNNHELISNNHEQTFEKGDQNPEVVEEIDELVNSVSNYETANENNTISTTNISWHSSEAQSSSPYHANLSVISQSCEVLAEDSIKESLEEKPELESKIAELQISIENVREAKDKTERLLVLAQESVLKAFHSFYPKYQLPEKIPINDEIALKLILSEFNSLVLNSVQDLAETKMELKRKSEHRIVRENEKLKKEIDSKNQKIEALEQKLLDIQELHCSMLSKFGL